MKRSFKMIVMMLALTFGALIFNGASSQAAVSITNVKQIKASSSYVELQWDAVIYGDGVYYRVYYGSSADSLTGYSDTSSTDETLYRLTEGSTYYARVVAFADYKRQTPIAESEVIQVSTSLKEVANTKQTGATANSVTLTWDAVAGATAYEIYRYDGWKNYTQVGSSVGTTATISGLNASSRVQLFVIPTKVINGTTTISGTDINTIYVKTAPSKVQYIALTNFWHYLNDAQFGWNAVQNADGYQLQVQNYKGKNLYNGYTTSTYRDITPFFKNVFTKARARAYVEVNGQRVFGPWSGFTYTATSSSVKVIRSANKKKITVKWKKVKGATSYTIYASTKQNSGFKKIKTISAKKKSSYTFKKIGKKKLKKRKKYYVRVAYNTKVGKKTVKSRIEAAASVY